MGGVRAAEAAAAERAGGDASLEAPLRVRVDATAGLFTVKSGGRHFAGEPRSSRNGRELEPKGLEPNRYGWCVVF